MQAAAHYVHNLSPFAVQFPAWAPVPGLRWYGLAYIAGFVVAAWVLRWAGESGRAPSPLHHPGARQNYLFTLVLGALIGGRVGYALLYNFSATLASPLSIFAIWEGGMASHGGFAGTALAAAWFAHRQGAHWKHLLDCTVILAPAGILFGRVANFINGELWGTVTTVPWAVIFPAAGWEARHPSQLYAAGLEGLVLGIFTLTRFRMLYKKQGNAGAAPGSKGLKSEHKNQKGNVANNKNNKQLKTNGSAYGQLTGEFCMAYATLRIMGEQFRMPDAGLVLGVSRGVFFSSILFGAGFALYAHARRGKAVAA